MSGASWKLFFVHGFLRTLVRAVDWYHAVIDRECRLICLCGRSSKSFPVIFFFYLYNPFFVNQFSVRSALRS